MSIRTGRDCVLSPCREKGRFHFCSTTREGCHDCVPGTLETEVWAQIQMPQAEPVQWSWFDLLGFGQSHTLKARQESKPGKPVQTIVRREKHLNLCKNLLCACRLLVSNLLQGLCFFHCMSIQTTDRYLIYSHFLNHTKMKPKYLG